MNNMETLRNAGLVCSKPSCACAQMLGSTLTPEQVHDLDQARQFVASLTKEQQAMLPYVGRFFGSLTEVQSVALDVIVDTIDEIGAAPMSSPLSVLDAGYAATAHSSLGQRPKVSVQRTGTDG
jgi:hypothetical protein